jgi:hypothetical protein
MSRLVTVTPELSQLDLAAVPPLDSGTIELTNNDWRGLYITFTNFYCCDLNLQGHAPQWTHLPSGEKRRFFISVAKPPETEPSLERGVPLVGGRQYLDWEMLIFVNQPGREGDTTTPLRKSILSCKLKLPPDTAVGSLVVFNIEADVLDEQLLLPTPPNKRIKSRQPFDDDDDDEEEEEEEEEQQRGGELTWPADTESPAATAASGSQFLDREAQDDDDEEEEEEDYDDDNKEEEESKADAKFISNSSDTDTAPEEEEEEEDEEVAYEEIVIARDNDL